MSQFAPSTSSAPSAGLPSLAERYVRRTVGAASGAATVWIEQRGEMVLRPGAAARRFRSTEVLAADRVWFAWQARFQIFRLLAINVLDSYDGTDGRLEVRVGRIPIRRSSGPDLAEAEAIRYLAELPWVPHAMLTNNQLSWCQLDRRTLEVSAPVNAQTISVRLSFDDQGQIEQVRGERRRSEAGNRLTPWVGTYSDYQSLGGVLIPTRAEVAWGLPEGPFTYWRGEVTSLEVTHRRGICHGDDD